MSGRGLIEGGRSFLPVCKLDLSHLGRDESRRAAKAPGGLAGWRSNKNKAGSLTIPGLASAAARNAAAYLVLRFAAVLGAARPAGFAVLAAGLAGFFALAAVFAMILSKG